MNEIIEISEGAFFVPIYSEQTVVMFQPGVNAQIMLNSYDMQEQQEISPKEPLDNEPFQ